MTDKITTNNGSDEWDLFTALISRATGLSAAEIMRYNIEDQDLPLEVEKAFKEKANKWPEILNWIIEAIRKN